MSTTWIVVADRGRARILAPCDHERTPLDEIVHFVGRAGYVGPDKFPAEKLDEIEDFVYPEGELPQRELESDRPGKIRAEGVGTSYQSTHVDLKHLTAEDFAREVVAYLDRSRQEHRFDKLILVAPPLFLGVLRQQLSNTLKKLVALEIDKDYTKLKTEEIRAHLPSAL